MKITIDVSDAARKIREHGLQGIDNAAELLAESAFFVPAEDACGKLLGILARHPTRRASR